MAKDPAARYPDGRVLAEDVEDVLAGRPPRHREGWTAPALGTGTLASGTASDLPELTLEPAEPPLEPAEPPPRSRRRGRTTARLIAALGAVSALYFYLNPGDWQFWRRAVAEARRSHVVDEVRGWWARLVVEAPADVPPGAPAGPALAPATKPVRPEPLP